MTRLIDKREITDVIEEADRIIKNRSVKKKPSKEDIINAEKLYLELSQIGNALILKDNMPGELLKITAVSQKLSWIAYGHKFVEKRIPYEFISFEEPIVLSSLEIAAIQPVRVLEYFRKVKQKDLLTGINDIIHIVYRNLIDESHTRETPWSIGISKKELELLMNLDSDKINGAIWRYWCHHLKFKKIIKNRDKGIKIHSIMSERLGQDIDKEDKNIKLKGQAYKFSFDGQDVNQMINMVMPHLGVILGTRMSLTLPCNAYNRYRTNNKFYEVIESGNHTHDSSSLNKGSEINVYEENTNEFFKGVVTEFFFGTKDQILNQIPRYLVDQTKKSIQEKEKGFCQSNGKPQIYIALEIIPKPVVKNYLV